MASLDSLIQKASSKNRPGFFLDESGADFVLYSEHARGVSVEIFSQAESKVFPLEKEGNLWRVRIEGVNSGMRYGYRVKSDGSCGTKESQALLLDPYAQGYAGHYEKDSSLGAAGLFSVVPSKEAFDWEGDAAPSIPMEKTVFYETHVKGATKLNFEITDAERGTYAGLASKAFISHVKSLGVTSLELLPIFEFIDEDRLIAKGLKNFWGYNPVGFFAPARRYARNQEAAPDEFRAMVKKLHAAGLEVILDVVFNHTAETDETGPTLSFRGIDNSVYYKIREDDPNLYVNFTGCGNTFNVSHPAVLELVLDSLRFWVQSMHVDGFRFDLASTLTRESAFLEKVKGDPILSGVKLIAEPWDIGPDGYRLGRFGAPFSEWNDRFRDDMRAFWLTHTVGVGALAQRLCASSEIFRYAGRAPQASLNFITAHDGFTLSDLVSYAGKHNDANGEANRDGTDRNLSVNCGVEGETQNVDIARRRKLLRRALLASLFFSQGTPMLLGGDEICHTQEGNNNAYCQDNTTTWIDWDIGKANDEREFISKLTQIRSAYSQLRSTQWLTGELKDGERDIVWLNRMGREMHQEEWNRGFDTLGALFGRCDGSERLLIYFYRGGHPEEITLPEGDWTEILRSDVFESVAPTRGKKTITLTEPTVLVFTETVRGFPRESGVLLHVSSLPSVFGSGDFGREARHFVNWLEAAHQSLWQVLPLTVTGEGNSPYMGASVFAGNELFIDFEDLAIKGYIVLSELKETPHFDENRVDFPKVSSWRMKLLERAALRFFSQKTLPESYVSFIEKEAFWLEDYALFRAISAEQESFGRCKWQEWPEKLRERNAEALKKARERLSTRINFWRFAQYVFAEQLKALRSYAHARGVRILGDLPIFVSPNSADVWAHRELFVLDKEGNPTAVAGVPPDYFSPTGQLWGNPLYDWKAHKESDYAWWKARIARAATLYDALRIDHFRGFESFWSVPAQSETALDGHWEKGPGKELFDAIKLSAPHLSFIAEDLGIITKEVDQLRESLDFPGMRVLQFAFDGKRENPHLPGNVVENAAYYPGTHDNDTILGWYESLDEKTKKTVFEFLGNPESVSEAALSAVFHSRARYAIVLAQDILGLDSQARMNRPGDATGSWGWRMRRGALGEDRAEKLANLTVASLRNEKNGTKTKVMSPQESL